MDLNLNKFVVSLLLHHLRPDPDPQTPTTLSRSAVHFAKPRSKSSPPAMASRRAISSALRTASRTRAASPSPCPRAPLHRPSPAGFLFNRAAAYASSAEAQPVRARPQRKSMVVVYQWPQHIDLSLVTGKETHAKC
jgi:hypothetical protein